MNPRFYSMQNTSDTAVVRGLALGTIPACGFEQSTGWGALMAATVRTRPSMRPEPFSDAPGTIGCPMNAARREGTIWESPAGWIQ